MSYRPTISIYVNGEIADYGYYRNWSDEDLFYEAIAYAALFYDCKTKEEYRDRAFHTQKITYIVSPERFENTQENLSFFEAHSEFPIIVDLSLQNIYTNYGAITDKELSVYHTIDNPYSFDEFVHLMRFKEKHHSEYQCDHHYSDAELKRYYRYVHERDQYIGTRMDFSTLLSYYRIPFDFLNMKEIKTMLRKDAILDRHCSKSICELYDAA